ncbi:hypothetical protein PR048_009622 [Dryococelus australis]|uniref:Uncharacterized protein n=1 Tax=Dryococelus australis TaxID=614101 RepID=A0ABQ9I0G6_9NEOP|nr:hypothetical protein PR048_009622 [Dryococelus australis]
MEKPLFLEDSSYPFIKKESGLSLKQINHYFCCASEEWINNENISLKTSYVIIRKLSIVSRTAAHRLSGAMVYGLLFLTYIFTVQAIHAKHMDRK